MNHTLIISINMLPYDIHATIEKVNDKEKNGEENLRSFYSNTF